MTTFLPDRKFFCATIPKVACTSLKKFFFKIENGTDFKPFVADSKKYSIHQLYRSRLLENYPRAEVLATCYKVTMVRDPLKRFLSAYSNRVTFHNELSIEKAGRNLKKAGLKPDPDIHTFIENFETYRSAQKSIYHHTRPMVEFIGENPRLFDKVYDISEIEDLRLDIVARLGKDYPMPHLQTGGEKVDIASLSDDEISKIRHFYAEDYDAWGSFCKGSMT